MIRRSIQMNDHLKRAREHHKQRESLSMTLPGYDTAMNTASKILNLTQDDLDDIMSTTDDSFQVLIFLVKCVIDVLLIIFREIPNMRISIRMKKYDKKFRNYLFHRKNFLVNF
jgi:hypothetical protein